VPIVEKAMEAGRFVLRRASARGGWGQTSRKGKKGRRGESSDEESDNEVLGVETGSESDSEEDERRKRKKSVKEEVRMKKVSFEDEGKRKKNGQENVDELTRKLLRLNVKDDVYAAAYAQLFVLAPEMTDNLPLPSHFRALTVAEASTTMTPSYPRYSQPSAPMPYNFPCHFCKKLECCLRTCPTAVEYVHYNGFNFKQMDITLTWMDCQSTLITQEDSREQ